MIASPPRPSSRLLTAFLSCLLCILFSIAYNATGAHATAPHPQAIEDRAAGGRSAETSHPADAAVEVPAIDVPVASGRFGIPGPSIEAALVELHRQLNDRRIGENPLKEILNEGDPSLAERYGDARIRLRERHALDSLLARPEVQLSVFFEEEARLSAELWHVGFERHGEGWKAERFEPLLTAHLGFRFSLREDEVYAFDHLTIERPAGVFVIEDGLLMPGFSEDRIGRAVLVGSGRFSFTPPNRVERHQMNKYARTTEDTYTTGFDRMVLVLSPEGYVHLVEGVALSRVKGGRAFDRAKALLNRVDRDYLLEMKPARERFSLAHTHPDFLQAEIDLAESDRWLVYTNSPYESESVSLVQKSGFPRNPDISPPVVWCRFSPGPEEPSGRADRSIRAAEEETLRGPLLSLDHYDIAGSLEDNGRRIRMKTTLAITARADPLTAATLTLNPDFDVYRVDYAGGDGALFTRQGIWLTVPFRHPVPTDSTTTLTLWYEGDVFRGGSGGFFGLLTNQQWLPVHSNEDLYTFDLELRYPGKLTVATVGAQVASHAEEDARVTSWRRTRPVSSLGMTVSENHTRTVSAGGIDVILSVDEDRRAAEPNTARILAHIGPALDFFGGVFGPYPYEKLDIV